MNTPLCQTEYIRNLILLIYFKHNGMFSTKIALCSLFFYSIHFRINLLTPNVNYSGRTAPLTSKVAFYIFIKKI